MEIVSWTFLAFVIFVLAVYRLLPPKAQNAWLLLASYGFVASWGLGFLAVLLVTTLLNYFLAQYLWFRDRRRKLVLWLGLAVNVGALVYFRFLVSGYANRLLAVLDQGNQGLSLEIFLPLGFSFYVLQTISYLVDVYRKQIPASQNIVAFSLYLAYFPKFISGPIERARSFLPRLENKTPLTDALRQRSLALILLGLARKLILSGLLLTFLPEDLFSAPSQYARFELVTGLLVYAFWIYNDFAGYVNIVRGISGLFGIELSRNFEQPYFARNFTEFWNRWHITLSHWLRDYIFYPLNRALRRRVSRPDHFVLILVPPLLTMLASGFWHNLSVAMLVWGGLHGCYLAGERLLSRWRPVVPPDDQPLWCRVASAAAVFTLTCLAWVPFAAGGFSKALRFYRELIVPGGGVTSPGSGSLLPVFLIAGSLLLDALQRLAKEEAFFVRWPLPTQGLLLAGFLLVVFYISFFWGQPVEATFLYQSF